MHRLFAGLSRFVVRYRFLVVLVWVLGAVAATRALPSLGSQINNDNSQFLSPSAPSEKAAELLSSITGNSLNDTEIQIVAARDHRALDAADVAALEREVTAARRLRSVAAVRWVVTSPEGDAAQLLVTSTIHPSDVASQKALCNELQATFREIAAPTGLQLHLAGAVATNVANQSSSNVAGGKAERFSFLLIIVVLLVVFRSLLAPLVTLAPAGLALVLSMRIIGGLGAHGLKISEITQLLLIVLLLGAGTDYGLFLVYRVREEVRRGLSPREAVVHALQRVGESISASAGTVIVALLSLVFASFGVYRDLGAPLAIGVAVMLLAGLTLLPALLAIAGRALFWPSRVEPGTHRDGNWERLISSLLRRPALTLLAGIAFFGALALGSLSYHASGFGGALSAPSGTGAAAGNALVARDFPHASFNPANLVLRYKTPVFDAPGQIARAEASLAASHAFAKLAGPLDASASALSPAAYARLHALLGDPTLLPPDPPASARIGPAEYDAYRTTLNFVSADGRTVQFEATLRAGAQSSTAALDATPRVRSALSAAARSSGAEAYGVGGEAAALYDISTTSNSDLLHIVPIAVVAIGILLALVLRSLVAELYLIASVTLSYLAALGLSSILFIDLGGTGGLTFILPFLMFIFLLALGEDYNILVMTRIREEAHSRSLREAVVRAVSRTGPTVTSAGVVLAGTFAVLVLAAGSGPGAAQIRDIGVGLALGILMDTFLVRTLLVPATVILLGRWNWWPSRLSSEERPESAELVGVGTKT